MPPSPPPPSTTENSQPQTPRTFKSARPPLQPWRSAAQSRGQDGPPPRWTAPREALLERGAAVSGQRRSGREEGHFCAQPRLPRAGWGRGEGGVGGPVLPAFELEGQQFSTLGLNLRQSAAAPCWTLSCLRPASPVGESWHPEARARISWEAGPGRRGSPVA